MKICFHSNLETIVIGKGHLFFQVTCDQSLRVDLMISTLNTVGWTSVNKAFVENTLTCMWNVSMCVCMKWSHRHKYCTLRNTGETVKQPKQGNYGSVVWCWQEQYPSGGAEAALLSFCDWIRAGLVLLPAPREPQVLPVAGLGGLWQFTRVQNCPKTL